MKPKITVLIILAVLLMTALAVGFSFALWTTNNQQANSNTVLSGCLSINYAETAGSLINLQNHYPISDEMGASTDPYVFTVTNTCTTYASYQVNVESLSTSTVSPTFVRVMLDNDLSNTLNTFSNVEETNTGATAFNIKTLELAPNESVTHNFRMWVDKAATQSDVANKKIDIKVSVVASTILPTYTDPVLLGSDPVLDSKMIPVNIADTGVVTVADIYEDTWYNYGESKWANAVIVDPTFTTLDPGTTIPMESIEQMYVWIPRYEYKKSSIVNAQESIEINFVPISTVNTDIENNDVIIHPAFTFGGVEQAGLWIGKFEMGFNDGESETTTNVEYIIKPNVNSVHNINICTLFDKINNAMETYSMDATTDVHMMKNTEWGAVAYLSQSKYGICEDDVTCSVKIEKNNYFKEDDYSYDIVTGCGGTDSGVRSSSSGINICPTTNRWETANGIKASTTHNITGIYDMAGGRHEYVMGNMQDSSGNFYSSSAGFTNAPDAKYYDLYEYGTTYNDQAAYSRGLYGDATVELSPSGSPMSDWNSDNAYFVNSSYSWFLRGGHSYDGNDAGVWKFLYGNGATSKNISARSVSVVVQ